MPNLFKNSRSDRWYVWFYDPDTGKRRQMSTRTSDKKEAKRFATERLPAILRCDRPPIVQDITLAQFTVQYLEVCSGTLTDKTVKTIKDGLTQFQKRVGDRLLSSIGVRDCEMFISTGQPSVYSQRKHYGHLRAAMKRAVEWNYIAANPFERVKKPRAPQRETDYFRPSEYRNFLDSLPTDSFAGRRLRNAIVLAYETGLRLGEIRNLERTAYSLDVRMLTVRNSDDFTTKSKKERIVPLSENAMLAIREQVADNFASKRELVRESRYLFPNESGGVLSEPMIGNAFAHHRRVVYPDRKLSFHSLRHSFGTRLAKEGASPQLIQRLMGHSSITVTERYTHLRDLDLSPALAILDSAPSFLRPAVAYAEAEAVTDTFD